MSTRGNDLERPLTARSVIASVLLGTHPPVLPVQLIVRTTELFGLSENATRVALSRMVGSGELTTVNGRYRLAGHLVERQRRQSTSRRPELLPWDGEWVLAVVEPGARSAAARADFRKSMNNLRLAQLREGVWTRPTNLKIEARPSECTWWTARPDGDPPLHLWDLDRWAARAGELRSKMATGIEDLGPAFVLAAAVLRHLQSDPLLPPELLPKRWPGSALREEYEAYEADFRMRLAEWFQAATA